MSGGVLQHHGSRSRDGVFVDPVLTTAAVASLHLDPSFAGVTVDGLLRAQPLYLDGVETKPDVVIAATTTNHVYAFSAADGSVVWDRVVAPPVPISQLPCGTPTTPGVAGIAGTPIIDGSTRTMYLDALATPDGGTTIQHLVFALDADTGNTRPGWPVDVAATARFGTLAFNAKQEGQHAALALLAGTLFIPYGAPNGDCGEYHGWIVGISIADPTHVTAWASRGLGAGVWATGGITADQSSLYFATGNGTTTLEWLDQESIFKVPPSLVFSGSTKDYFVPANWPEFEPVDNDLGSTAPLVVDAPGASPSALLMGLGKDRHAYLLDRSNLSGIGAPLAGGLVALEAIIGAPVAYTTTTGTYVLFRARGLGCPPHEDGWLTALRITPTAPPTLQIAWCGILGQPSVIAAPSVSMTDAQGSNTIIWIVSLDDKLHGLDGNTFATVFDGGADVIPGSLANRPPIIAKGRIFVPTASQIYAFKP